MGLIELFFIAVGLSMDAFAVSICKGLACREQNLRHNMLAGLYFGGFQGLMPAIGWLLGVRFSAAITSIDHWIAFVLLCFIGGSMIRESRSEEDEEEMDAWATTRSARRGSRRRWTPPSVPRRCLPWQWQPALMPWQWV